jgi:hypothetical protein
MTVPSLYSAKAFYDSTSALSANPFYNPRTCGVSSTLRSCGLGQYPQYGNIGYANRIETMGENPIDQLWAGLKKVGSSVIDYVAPTVGNWAEQMLGAGRKAALEKSGYQFLEVVQVNYQGKPVAGTKIKKPDNTFAIMLADGTEIPYTTEVAKQTQTVDPKTGNLSTAATTGLIVGGVALVALLFFMSKRR